VAFSYALGSALVIYSDPVSLFPFSARIPTMMAATMVLGEGHVEVDVEVNQLRRGDLDALSVLITRYQNRLYRYLLRLVRNAADADDLFQQTWIRVAEQIRRYDPSRNFDAWLFTLARHLAIDHLRRRRPESLDEPLTDDLRGPAKAATLVAQEPSALDGILESERDLRLAECFAELPVYYREVLSLRFEEEMKLEEIAFVLDAPLSTVKSRLKRALESLRARLESAYPGERWTGGRA
jgi:RNA polymerase sigma-70 factor, ECF subfamily